MTAGADAEVEAFNAYAEWCKNQAQDDGHQQETLDASIASTNAAIENFTAKAECRERKEAKDFSESEAELFDVVNTLQRATSISLNEMAKNSAFFVEVKRHTRLEQCCGSSSLQ